MKKEVKSGFDILIDYAGQFVEVQKGIWNHENWLDFLIDAQKRAVVLSDDMKSNLGLVLESMKKVYSTVTDTRNMESVMLDISEHTINFFKKNNGVWNYSDWEEYLIELQQKGFELNEETCAYLSEVLEAVKGLYPAMTYESCRNLLNEQLKK
jgi:hypothetical protein